jgi:4,5-dihydroxyphthalate decarboxylase
MPLRLKTTCAPNPRIDPLVEGLVTVPNVEFDWDLKPVPMLFLNNIKLDNLELSEMSMSETLLTIDRRPTLSNGRWMWWALPIFLARGHFWTGLVANVDSGIKDLGDLKGKRVAIPDYCMTAALWMKVTLKDMFGIEAGDIEWFNWRPRGESQALELELDKDPPPGVSITWLTKDHDPVAMIERGEIDVAVGVNDPRLRDNPKVRRIMPDNGRQLIGDFYQKTGCFQPNHHFIIQRRIIDGQPESAMDLYNAFRRSKEIAYERGGRKDSAYLYFEGDTPERQASVFGDDPYPMGLSGMRPTLERLIKGSLEQGLIRREVKLDEIYHPSTLNT